MNEPDYKNTLNLPKTDFPMKANLANREPEMLKRWYDMDLYKKILAARNPIKKFILNDGPPYANGDIHIGHALNKILKDIVIKSQSMNGYYAPYIPGWDCHGLPIELQVEKKHGKPGVKIDANEFRKKCREYAAEQVDKQRESFKRLGVFGDWDNPYKTMDFGFEANIIRTLGKIVANGHLSKGERPVHWCVHCGSALAEAEVEYQDKTSPSIDVAFPVVDQQKIKQIFNLETKDEIQVVIWTTTPWTLPANQAVTVHAELVYVLLQLDDRCIVVAKDLLPLVANRLGIEEPKIIAETLGNNLEKLELQHPFYDRKVPVIIGEHVTTDAGTGCVHTAPAHGNDDYNIGRQYGLPIDNPVDPNGCFYVDTPLFGGEHVFKANAKVIEVLKQRNYLLAEHKIQHSYPHCWRHKEPLIFRATQQWFVNMEQKGLREKALAEIKKVKWIPTWGEARITKMVEGRPDWCISRQRTWGTPLTLIVHEQTGELHPNIQDIIAKAADLVEQQGIQAWFDLEVKDLIPESEATNYIKVTDTLDVWFDSGAVHACVADDNPQLGSPVDLYLEGSDQHRGWFQTSLLSSVATKDIAPFKQVLTHGFTVDAQGRKMSKSLGNVIAPDKVMKTLGADILRLWVAATDYRSELNVSDEILKRTSDAYRRIRNTARFLLANLDGFDPVKDLVNPQDMLALDSWIVSKATALQAELIKAYDDYNFHIIYQLVHNFCSDLLGSFYLDVIKDRQYTCKTDGIPRRSAQTAMYYLIEYIVRWIAPILSFTADEIWQFMPGKREDSVFLATWYQAPNMEVKSSMNDDFWSDVLGLRSEVNKLLEQERKAGNIGSGLESEVFLYCSKNFYNKLLLLEDELRYVLITSEAKIFPIENRPEKDSFYLAISNNNSKIIIESKKSPHPKCQRCWHRREDVDASAEHPGICKRCVENLSSGETRKYA